MKQITPDDLVISRRMALDLAESWQVVQPSDALRNNAEHLVEHYKLKAADAMQLAAALEWCDQVPSGETFLTADQKLREAAVLGGFNGKAI